jgi:photosystem II stability/assembly factor-like uncharacterized protein
VIVPLPPTAAVAFVDARHGWAGGQGGLLGTTDGRTFRVQVRAPIIGISAFDRARAWAITGDGFVLRTFDGRRWSRLGAPHLFHIQFVDARRGFGLTRDGAVVRSTDAGRTWRQVPTPGLVQSECFVNAARGWIARGGSIWSTGNAGRRWVRARLQPLAKGFGTPVLGCRGGDAWALFSDGVAAGTENYRVYRAGARWRAVLASPFQRRLPSISNYAGPFSVLGGGVAVFTGSCAPCDGFGTATVVRTLDGGASFRRSTPFRGYVPDDVCFTDAAHGWLLSGSHVGSATPARLRILWRTADGGRTWRSVLHSTLLAP